MLEGLERLIDWVAEKLYGFAVWFFDKLSAIPEWFAGPLPPVDDEDEGEQ